MFFGDFLRKISLGGKTTNLFTAENGFAQSSQGGKDAMIFATKTLRHKVTRRHLIFFIPLSGNWGGHEFTNCLQRRSRENRVCAEAYEKDAAFARS